MAWKPYNKCCHASALDPIASFCGECGTSLIRCIAFSECCSIVRPQRLCAVCVSIELSIDRGAVTAATVGQKLSIPLVLRNTAAVERPIWIKDIEMRLGTGPFEKVPLMWERIDRGEERALYVETGALEAGGTGTITLAITLASRYKGYEESYVLGGAVRFNVDAASDGKIVQNIDLSGATLGTGTLIHTPLSTTDASTGSLVQASERIPVPLEPYERYEIERGVRGYSETGHRVPRNVEFKFMNFPEGHAPSHPLRISSRGMLIFGRNLRAANPEDNSEPSDVTLRVIDLRTREVDRESSFAVSRRHFDFLVLNERLYVHVRSGNGAVINDARVATTHLAAVNDGDTISPIQSHPDMIRLKVSFLPRADGVVENIQVAREH